MTPAGQRHAIKCVVRARVLDSRCCCRVRVASSSPALYSCRSVLLQEPTDLPQMQGQVAPRSRGSGMGTRLILPAHLTKHASACHPAQSHCRRVRLRSGILHAQPWARHALRVSVHQGPRGALTFCRTRGRRRSRDQRGHRPWMLAGRCPPCTSTSRNRIAGPAGGLNLFTAPGAA